MARACDVPGVEFHFLTPHNLHRYLDKDALHPNYARMKKPNMAANCIRAALLAKYGGWWWDADTVGLQSPLELTQQYPDASMLYMTWSLPPRRILNGYIYARPGAPQVKEWLKQINHKIEHNLELAGVWLELGEKILSPLLEGQPDCVEIPRRLFLPIDIDRDVKRFFQKGDFREVIEEDTVCFGLNHSWMLHNEGHGLSWSPRRWRSSRKLFHQLLHHARTTPWPDPPPNRTAVVTLASGEYWKGAEVLFRSLQSHGMPDSVDRVVISNDPVTPSFAKRVPITRNYGNIETKAGQFAQTADKFFALTLDYDRIILIDSDIFCVQDCSFLWSEDHLNALPFYAVHDTATNVYYADKIKAVGLDKNLLFNAGTMVYNRSRMPDLHDKLLEAIREGWCQTYDGGDQGYLNAFFQGIGQEVGSLPVGYNFLLDQNMPQVPVSSRYLFHFAGQGLKPWHPGFARKDPAFAAYVQQWKEENKASQGVTEEPPPPPVTKRVALVYFNNDKYVSRGPGYVASAAIAAGHQVDFFDTAYRTPESVVPEIVSGEYDCLLLSASSLFYGQAKRLAAAVKRESAMPVLLGGIHATIAKGAILEECPEIDYLCVGEGEEFIVDFLAASDDAAMRQIDNLGYRAADGAAVVNPVRPPTDLDKLPPLKYDLFPPEAVVQNYPRPGFCYVWATRGCPYKCSYCCNTAYLNLYKKNYLRTRSVDQVIAELLYLKEHYPVKIFYFGDEMILFDESYVTELFGRVQAETGLPFGCMSRVERITPSIVRLLARTGCKYVGLGVECGNEEFRKEFLNRHMTNARIIQAFAMLRTIEGMFLTSFNMRGYPVPYDAQLTRETEALNAAIKPNHIQTSVMYPFPGTEIHRYCVEHDLIDPAKVQQLDKRGQEYFSKSVLRDQLEQMA